MICNIFQEGRDGMRYAEIFNEIVDIMHHDYAGCYDKAGWDNPEVFSEKINLLEEHGALTPHSFKSIVQDYLLDFQDPHMFFKRSEKGEEKQLEIGFKVRRFENKLYVISVGSEKRLKKGEALLSFDGVSIEQLVTKHQSELMEKVAERERWEDILKRYSKCVIEDHKGNLREIEIELYKEEKYLPRHTVENIDESTLLITLTDFDKGEAMKKLIHDYQQDLEQTPNLIIDVRLNIGGSTQTFQEFLTYLFPEGSFDLANMLDYKMEFHCTERNCSLQKKKTDKYLKETEDEDNRKWILNYQKGWIDNWGKGFIDFNDSEEESSHWIQGKPNPENIVLLTDVKCGSAGDIFVEIVQQSSKVTVVGRPTANINAYSNLIDKEWDNTFELWYPTSKIVSENEVEGGQPDIYIPWTPEHLDRDVDMDEGVRLLKRQSVSKYF